MQVTLLYHSGCLIELEKHILLFDYYQGELELNPEKPLYIFVSHRHYDHYNPNIFKIKHPHITYILSASLRQKYPANYVDVNQNYTFDDIHVKTYFSTDEGCAFLVEVENKKIYHAGDLNWWHWQGEPEQDNLWQKEKYQEQINLIKEKLDFACVVVDQRQEEHYLLGLNYFLKHVQTQYVLPIHYFGDYSISEKLRHENLENPFHANILHVTHSNQVFHIREKNDLSNQ